MVNLLRDQGRNDLLNVFASQAVKSKGAKHKVFQDRYDSKVITGNKFFQEKLNYIHNNPCQKKWGLVENPEEYKHSSASNYFLGKGIYDVKIFLS